MSDTGNAKAAGEGRKLSDAIREVKNQVADRDDVVVEMREASRMRLELLAQELEPVFADVPADNPQFDFAISSGLQPRLWIDAVAHVAMGRDKRAYRFVRDTRNGRVVLSETTDIKAVADSVTRYVAERIVERQRQLDGEPVGAPRAANDDAAAAGTAPEAQPARRGRALLSGALTFLFGAAAGAAILAAIYWDRVAAYLSGL